MFRVTLMGCFSFNDISKRFLKQTEQHVTASSISVILFTAAAPLGVFEYKLEQQEFPLS